MKHWAVSQTELKTWAYKWKVFLKAARCCHHCPQEPCSECIVQVGLAPASNYWCQITSTLIKFFWCFKICQTNIWKTNKSNKKAKLDWEMPKFSKCGCMLIPEMKFSFKTRPHIPYSTTPLLYLLLEFLKIPQNGNSLQRLVITSVQFSTGHQRDLQNCNLSRKFLLIWFRWHGNQRSVTLSPQRDAHLINFVVMFPLYCLKNCFWTLKLGNFTLDP